jgi:hypothetical protein
VVSVTDVTVVAAASEPENGAEAMVPKVTEAFEPKAEADRVIGLPVRYGALASDEGGAWTSVLALPFCGAFVGSADDRAVPAEELILAGSRVPRVVRRLSRYQLTGWGPVVS